MKNLVLTLVVSCFAMIAYSQKVQTKVIHTSAECGACKDRLEEVLNYTSGVKFAELDLETMDLTVKFKTSKVSLEEIKVLITETGYDADDLKAKPEALEQLPACCKPGGMEKQGKQ
jgi:mercuric ion binding protein